MKRGLERDFPPYEGEEPYLFLCFSPADAGKLRPLLRRLWIRGARIWYPVGQAASREERSRRAERQNGAALTVLYLTSQARKDLDVKSAVLLSQAQGQRVISIDTDDLDSGLSMGLTEHVRHLRPERGSSPAEVEAALVRTEGFSQDLLGPPRPDPGDRRIRRTIGAFALAAALLIAAGFLFIRYSRPAAAPTEEVVFADETLARAVRQAAGGGPLTVETLSAITTLPLDSLPEDLSELALLPALRRLEIPLALGTEIGEEFPAGVEVVLTGGAP